jgi:quercetin dioxygenase-like cupin family protein
MAELESVTVSRREGRPLNRREAEQRLRDEGLNAEAWQNGPDYTYIAHDHPYTKVLYCVVGSIVFHVHDDSGPVQDIALEPGDRLEIGSGISHSATVGPNGVICVEGARVGP